MKKQPPRKHYEYYIGDVEERIEIIYEIMNSYDLSFSDISSVFLQLEIELLF
jgi:hypothetical protein